MFEIHLISFPDFFEGEADVINELLDKYEVYLHLRKPKARDDEYIGFVKQIKKEHFPKLVLHSCYSLADEYTFAACHFSTGRRMMANSVGSNKILCTSCHSIEELSVVCEVFNQCFLSPVFDSISKEGYASAFLPKELKKALETNKKMKVIALGGIDASNIDTVKKMGFDGAALLGAIWGDKPDRGGRFDDRLKDVLDQI